MPAACRAAGSNPAPLPIQFLVKVLGKAVEDSPYTQVPRSRPGSWMWSCLAPAIADFGGVNQLKEDLCAPIPARDSVFQIHTRILHKCIYTAAASQGEDQQEHVHSSCSAKGSPLLPEDSSCGVYSCPCLLGTCEVNQLVLIRERNTAYEVGAAAEGRPSQRCLWPLF